MVRSDAESVPVLHGPVAWARPVGVASLAFIVLVCLAFDDITTDTAQAFEFEYTILAVATAWFVLVSSWLIWSGRRAAGLLSLVALCGALWAQQAIGPGTRASLEPEYLTTLAALAWFLGLSLWLTLRGARASASQGL